METVLKAIADWIKGILTAGIMSNLSGLFDDVNTQVGNIAQQVGTRPSAFEPRVFAMIESLSRNVVLPIAGIILTFIACYELIEMITQHNNMAQFEPALIMRWIFKTAVSVWLISNTFDIVMAVFDVTQKVVSDSSSIIAGNTRVNDIGLSMLQSSAGLQHGKPNVVDTGVSSNDAAGIGHHLLGDIEHRHHDVKSIADEPYRNSGLKNPAHDECRLKLRHVVVLGDHLDEFITGDEGQDDACNGQHHIPGQRFDHRKNTRFKGRWSCTDLLCDVAHLGVYIIKQPAEIGHNACRQDAFDPVGNGFENSFHSAVTVL